MRWLLAAAKAAQRRWRLTNLLLLLLRCVVILLAALALARPTLAGLGGGHRLVLVIDRTASMGPRGSDPGPLAAAKAALSQAQLPYESVAVAMVDSRVEVIADGPPAAALAALGTQEAEPLPGGLDNGVGKDGSQRLSALIDHASDVLMVSDFAQDDGTALLALLQPQAHQVQRWRVGSPSENAGITGISGLGDQLPDAGGELTVHVAGASADIELALDDAPYVLAGHADAAPAGVAVRIALPPMAEGQHVVHIRLQDHSLAYDNQLDQPVTIRPRIEALAVAQDVDFTIAALHADDQRSFSFSMSNPAQFANEPLPTRGVVVLRSAISSAQRLRDWVLGGGVLWADLARLRSDSTLAPLVAGVITQSGSVPGGPYTSGEGDIDEVLSIAGRTMVPATTLPPEAEVLLRAGKEPVAAAIPAGRGWVVAELADLVDDRDLIARGTAPWWVVRTARRLASRLDAPRQGVAGAPAPQAMTLGARRRGRLAGVAGDAVLLAPGPWTSDQGTVVVLPSREEGRLDRTGAPGAAVTLDRALPRASGADLGPFLALLVLVAALSEGAFAAWAGRTYGR